ncbi:MAG: flagellar basal body protein [Sulfurimonas sp.]|nr:flagellar basal body protein [Sulfurimonas sp.]
MNISSNISSMQAHQTMMNASASNIANANTDGYIPKDTKISEAGNGVKADVRMSSDTGSAKSQTDLAKEITDQIVASKGSAANVTAIKAQDDIMGSMLDIKA